ncbi:MAG: adenylate/guanylate cyclase domain-containing protein [Alphaproteobacteria bacterium]|nr:adenylate/guanylate cyclase domain-containing protein [Alphaproteobacteria bacterium]
MSGETGGAGPAAPAPRPPERSPARLPDLDLSAPFRAEEWSGLKLAVGGKLLAVAVMSVYFLQQFSAPGVYWPLLFCAGFACTGCLQLWAGRRGPSWRWLRFVLVASDATLLAIAIATPNPFSSNPLPPQAPFRFASYVLFFGVFLATTAFAFQPRIVLVSGGAAALAWAGVAWHAYRQPGTVTWAGMPPRPTVEQVMARMGEPNFLDPAQRTVEVIAIVLISLLIAAAVWRSRLLVRRVLELEHAREAAEADRAFIRETFGKYVPEAVARAILADRGRLKPELRTATVLFADLEGFTALGERMAPSDLLALLNEYFDMVVQAVTRHGGVINQFQGDAVLATFNVPLPSPDHAAQAIRTACEIRDAVASRDFAGVRLKVRIGINTGALVAGAVGTADRLSYTVHGDAVNLAARLEQLNKEHGTGILLTAETARLAGDVRTRPIGLLPVRGKGEPVEVVAVE